MLHIKVSRWIILCVYCVSMLGYVPVWKYCLPVPAFILTQGRQGLLTEAMCSSGASSNKFPSFRVTPKFHTISIQVVVCNWVSWFPNFWNSTYPLAGLRGHVIRVRVICHFCRSRKTLSTAGLETRNLAGKHFGVYSDVQTTTALLSITT